MKDRFSGHAEQYAMFRPAYPEALVSFLVNQCEQRQRAWDCGTGNGQLAAALSRHFDHVSASDISAKQIANAIQHANIEYAVQPAERTNFPNNHFDLLTVAQAIHWFNVDAFYTEVQRVAKPGALLALIGYSPLRATEKFNAILDQFYFDIIHPYWDTERKLVDQRYSTLPFPFDEIQAPPFRMTYHWRKEEVEGYLNTWTAVQKYIHVNRVNPVDALMIELEKCWTAETLEVYFPIFSRLGFVNA